MVNGFTKSQITKFKSYLKPIPHNVSYHLTKSPQSPYAGKILLNFHTGAS